MHKAKTPLEGGNYYAEKLFFSKCLRIAILTMTYLQTMRWGIVVYGLVKYPSKRTRNVNHLRALLTT